MLRSSERAQVSPVIGVIFHCPRNYVNQNIISESYRNNPNNRDNLAALAAVSAAQQRLYAPRDTQTGEKLNKSAYLVEGKSIPPTRKKRVLDLSPRIHARRPAEGACL